MWAGRRIYEVGTKEGRTYEQAIKGKRYRR